VTTGHFITWLELSLNCDVDNNFLNNTWRKLVALVELRDFFVGLSTNAVDPVTDVCEVLRKFFLKISFEREVSNELKWNLSEDLFSDLSSFLKKFR
jgi:hypothetical protein